MTTAEKADAPRFIECTTGAGTATSPIRPVLINIAEISCVRPEDYGAFIVVRSSPMGRGHAINESYEEVRRRIEEALK